MMFNTMGGLARNTTKNASNNNFITNDLIIEEGLNYLESNVTIERWARTLR